jgi:hypothetical protein
LIFALLLLYFD